MSAFLWFIAASVAVTFGARVVVRWCIRRGHGARGNALHAAVVRGQSRVERIAAAVIPKHGRSFKN
jgi:hypothetical protein